jgi:hypothetical protein
MRWIVFLMITSPAAAEHWSCAFDAICRAGTPCTAAQWNLEIEAGDGQDATLRSARGATRLTQTNETARSFAGPDILVTINSEGVATLTAHDAPARSYLGICEDVE